MKTHAWKYVASFVVLTACGLAWAAAVKLQRPSPQDVQPRIRTMTTTPGDSDPKPVPADSKSVPDRQALRDRLTPEQFHVTQEKGTERAFTGRYWNTKDEGVYRCIVCGEPLFESKAKFDSGCGWPSFYQPENESKVATAPDNSYWMERTEVTCRKCGAHLGHVFDDGPAPTGLRYCINSASLDFEKKSDASADKASPTAERTKPGTNP